MKINKNNVLWIFLHLPKSGGTTFNGHLAKHLKEEFFHLDSRESRKKFLELTPEQKNKIRVLAGHETYFGIHKHFPNKKPRYITFIRNPAERLVSQYNRIATQSKEISIEKWFDKYSKNETVNFFNSRYKGFARKSPEKRKLIIPLVEINKKFKGDFLRMQKIKSIFGFFSSDMKKLENAKKLLDKCWFVGITENLDKDLKFLFKEIGVSIKYKNLRVSGKKSTWKNKLILEKKPAEKKARLKEELRKTIYKQNPLDLELYEYAKEVNEKFF